LDFAKAFDRVSHHKLITKLEIVGVHPRIVKWIESFLTDRAFNDCTTYLDNGAGADLIYLDFAKTFDRVCSELITKLEIVGVHPRIVKWIESFLTDR
ncbi:hypothetical protein COOONC_03071, partial [Cooperia oncophora]